METDWKAIELRLKADKKYYDGVLAGLIKHPPAPVGGRNTAQQQEAIAETVKRLDEAIKIVARLNA